ncbi:MAG: hypothetical protein ACC608_03885 [Anaerofustis sp.]
MPNKPTDILSRQSRSLLNGTSKDYSGLNRLAQDYLNNLKQIQDNYLTSRQDFLSGFSVSNAIGNLSANNQTGAASAADTSDTGNQNKSYRIDTDVMDAAAQKIRYAKAVKEAQAAQQQTSTQYSFSPDTAMSNASAAMSDALSAMKAAQLELRTERGSAEERQSLQQAYDAAKASYNEAKQRYEYASQLKQKAEKGGDPEYEPTAPEDSNKHDLSYYQEQVQIAQANLNAADLQVKGVRLSMQKSPLPQPIKGDPNSTIKPPVPAPNMETTGYIEANTDLADALKKYKQAKDALNQAQSALDTYSETAEGYQDDIGINSNRTKTIDTNSSATGSKSMDFYVKTEFSNPFRFDGDGNYIDDDTILQSYLDEFKQSYAGNLNEEAYEQAFSILKQLENGYKFTDESLQNAANELLSIQSNGDVQGALDELGSGSAKDYYYGVESVLNYEDNYNQAIFQAETYAKSGVIDDESAAKIAYDAYVDGLRMEDLNKIADILAGSDGGGDAEKIGSNLYYYLNWKDPEITALDKVEAVSSNFTEGVSDAAQGVATFGMKIVGLGEFVPEEWQQANWNEKMIDDVRGEMNGVGKTILDVSYTIGNMLPSMLAEGLLPGGGLLVTFVGTAGQTYNDAIRAGFSEKEATVYGLLNAAVSTATEKAFGIFGKETKGFNLTKEFKETFSGAIGKVLKNETAKTAVTAFLSNGTGEFVEELTEQLVNPIIENISFDGEQYTFANNPIGLTADDLYAAMIGFWTGGILGGGSDTIVDVNTTARLNTMMGNVRQNGESMGVSDRSIRLAQDLTLLTNQDVSFTQGQTQVNADGSIAINKDSATPMQDVVAVMREKGLLPAQTKSKAQNQSVQTTAYTYEQLKNMSGAQVKAAYGEMVSKYAEHLKKFGFTDAQVKGYVHEALKTKTAENRISSVMRLQEEMGALSESNALQGEVLNQTVEAESQTQQDSAELLKGEEETGRIKAEEQVESSAAEKAMTAFFDQINEIGRNEQLTVNERLQKIQEIYEALPDKGDLTVPSNSVFLTKQGFDKNGKPIYDWPGLLGFLKESIQSISKENTLPSRMSRFGSKSGNNLSGIKENGEFPTFDELGLPYADNPSARHQIEFDNELYFEVIDAISEGSLKKLNSLLISNGRTPYRQYEFDDLQIKYHYFLDNVEANDIQIDATYGLFGVVNEWKDKDTGEVLLKGGADQFTIPLSIQLLIDLGIIQKY